MKDVNKKKLLELKDNVENLNKANEESWKCLTKVNKELNELKITMKERELEEKFDSKSAHELCF